MKIRYSHAHMRAAKAYALLSYCKRNQVGCVIVRGNNVLSFGFNGTPPNHENCCEDANGLTKPEVIHAEDNAIRKLNERYISGEDSIMYCTLSPCLACATLIVNKKIPHVIYSEDYSKSEGVDFLLRNGVTVERLPLQEQ